MAIEKGLYEAPEGLDDMDMDVEDVDLEIEVVDPEAVTLSDGSMEITLIPDANIANLADFDANLAEMLDETQLNILSSDLTGLIEADVQSRQEWTDAYVKGL